MRSHWNGSCLAGPDPGIRFNARIGRFIKSYLSVLPWRDTLVYMQAQGYWVMNNWMLHDLTGEEEYRDLAIRCSGHVLELQRSAGYWDYPNPEWKGRIATVEGCFASLALLATAERTGSEEHLAGADKWYEYMKTGIGFRKQSEPGMLAVNYFAHETGDHGGVPNNATLAIWLLSRLYEVSGNSEYLEQCEPMLRWLRKVQLESGELPYALGDGTTPDRIHFLCYQYNAFEFVDLLHYFEITGDETVTPILERLIEYLSGGLDEKYAARFTCHKDNPEVTYYTSAIAHALSSGARAGLGDYEDMARRGYERVLATQGSHGGFQCYSRNNYRLLQDRRSYPRYLSMILHHLTREVTAAGQPLQTVER